jgi:hypothetical protein
VTRTHRLHVKCFYPEAELEPMTAHPFVNLVPTLPLTSPCSEIGTLSIEDQVSIQANKLLNSIVRKWGNLSGTWIIYFRTFHRSLPIIDKDTFYWQLEHDPVSSGPHYPTLMLSMCLVTQLLPQGEHTDNTQLYPTLKSIHSLLQSTGNVSPQLIQAGLLLATYELSQGLRRDAWLSVGACARMVSSASCPIPTLQ